jgi:hypothetical protein
MHGAKAPQAQRKSLERVLIADGLRQRKDLDPRDLLVVAVGEINTIRDTMAAHLADGGPETPFELEQYIETLDRCVKYAQVAIAAGVEERRVRLAESLGAQIASLIRGLLDRISATPAQLALVPGVLAELLPQMAGQVDGRVIEVE